MPSVGGITENNFVIKMDKPLKENDVIDFDLYLSCSEYINFHCGSYTFVNSKNDKDNK